MLLDLVACFLIPCYSLLFAGSEGWFVTNFSVLGSSLDTWPVFALWSLLLALYFNHCLCRLIPVMGGDIRLFGWKNLSLLLLFMAVTTPYLPHLFPFRAAFHVIFALLSALLLLAILLALIWNIWRRDPQLALPYLLSIGGIALGCLVLLLVAGIISTALELFLVITNTLFVRKMMYQRWV